MTFLELKNLKNPANPTNYLHLCLLQGIAVGLVPITCDYNNYDELFTTPETLTTFYR